MISSLVLNAVAQPQWPKYVPSALSQIDLLLVNFTGCGGWSRKESKWRLRVLADTRRPLLETKDSMVILVETHLLKRLKNLSGSFLNRGVKVLSQDEHLNRRLPELFFPQAVSFSPQDGQS